MHKQINKQKYKNNSKKKPMNQLINHPQFGQIRVETIKNEPWFCAKDVCDILGYKNSRMALKNNCFGEDVSSIYTPTSGGDQNMNYVSESGMYALIFGSRLEKAKLFKHWVTSEVLPNIRKYGFYQVPKLDVREQALVDIALWNSGKRRPKINPHKVNTILHDVAHISNDELRIKIANQLKNL
jgi:prophage antirepressor-like protein